jgi:uncharacterized protein YcbX
VIVVSGLGVTAIKGTRLRSVEHIRLEKDGVRENRRFFLIDARDRMVNAKHLGELQLVVAEYSDAERRLRVTFPDGRVVQDDVTLGDTVQARFYSGVIVGRLLDGPLSDALSGHVGQPLRLVEAPEAGGSVDRGTEGPVSLVSRGSLARLADEAGEPEVDGRRFRMLIEIDGVEPHAEDEWVGRAAQVGKATVLFTGHVGRCLITSRDPETGNVDLPTLDLLRSYRGELRTTEPLPFGIYGRVLGAGTTRVGDEVRPGDRLANP